ncbi:hypothetical protein ILYODFUR_006036 [Ilyodon furcidens]|uniref:Uncharacterized protein n=1 Tax=Ilyodon furcidens TaxID=33524 RepID=A0ABV0SIU7_9TELE
MVSPSSIHLQLPSHLRVHPAFHVSQIKPVLPSPLIPLAKPPPPVRDVMDTPYMMCEGSWPPVAEAGECCSWSTGRATALRIASGYQGASSCTQPSSQILKPLLCPRLEASIEGGDVRPGCDREV